MQLKNLVRYDPNQYKTQQMCEKAILYLLEHKYLFVTAN